MIGNRVSAKHRTMLLIGVCAAVWASAEPAQARRQLIPDLPSVELNLDVLDTLAPAGYAMAPAQSAPFSQASQPTNLARRSAPVPRAVTPPPPTPTIAAPAPIQAQNVAPIEQIAPPPPVSAAASPPPRVAEITAPKKTVAPAPVAPKEVATAPTAVAPTQTLPEPNLENMLYAPFPDTPVEPAQPEVKIAAKAPAPAPEVEKVAMPAPPPPPPPEPEVKAPAKTMPAPPPVALPAPAEEIKPVEVAQKPAAAPTPTLPEITLPDVPVAAAAKPAPVAAEASALPPLNALIGEPENDLAAMDDDLLPLPAELPALPELEPLPEPAAIEPEPVAPALVAEVKQPVSAAAVVEALPAPPPPPVELPQMAADPFAAPEPEEFVMPEPVIEEAPREMQIAALPPQPEPELEKAASQPDVAELIFGYEGEETRVPDSAKEQLKALAKKIIDQNASVRIVGYAGGPPEQSSLTRRISLARILDVRAHLINYGVPMPRITPQSQGNNGADKGGNPDRVEIFLQ